MREGCSSRIYLSNTEGQSILWLNYLLFGYKTIKNNPPSSQTMYLFNTAVVLKCLVAHG